MQIRQTQTLQNIFELGQHEAVTRLGKEVTSDYLFLAIIKHQRSHAFHILTRVFREWELYQIEIRVESELDRIALNNKTIDSEPKQSDDHKDLNTSILFHILAVADCCSIGKMLNSGCLLLSIVKDRRSISSKTLELYGMTTETLTQFVDELPDDEDYYDETEALKSFSMQKASLLQQDISYASPKSDNIMEQFGTELTKIARTGGLDPVVGRDDEVQRVIQILGRRKKNNPILIGEAGVGKSAIVEGLALKIVNNEVPLSLRNKRIFSLDIASLVAGTKYRGEFEGRIQQIIKELSKDKNTILFIDEIHNIVGAGSNKGSLDTANILKPVLARGGLQCIGATTLEEYAQSIEADGALERRFQKIIIKQPSESQTLLILNNIKEYYESHHNVKYSEDALRACVELTSRYVTDRCFPDKAIDVMDEAGSRAQISGEGEKKECQTAMQITADHINKVVSSMTGIPIEKISSGENQKLRSMKEHFSTVVIGQEEAVSRVTKAIQKSRSGLKDPERPIAVLMFVGPTGVGKTHLAKELANFLFDSNESIIRMDMSEYSEKHSVSRLIGSPPGYVGYGEGGQLTEKVRRNPYSVILFDEIEKAHNDIYNLLLQVMDEGQLTDGVGRKIDFRNSIIIFTSNVGSKEVQQRGNPVGYGTANSDTAKTESREAQFRKNLEKTFAPEFINRIDDIVVFNTLGHNDILKIVEREILGLQTRVSSLGYSLKASKKLKHSLTRRGYEPRYGVRSLKRSISDYVEEPISELIINGKVSLGDMIEADWKDDKISLKVS